jgi:hypothetical protein
MKILNQNNSLSIIILFTYLFLINCSSGLKVTKPFRKSTDFDLYWTFFYPMANANPQVVLSIFSQTISLDSIAPYFNVNDFYRFLPNKNIVNNFIENNNSFMSFPKDAFQPFAYILEKRFIDSKSLKANAKAQINFKTMDTLDNIFIRISKPGYNSLQDSALLYVEYYRKDWDYGEVYFYTRCSGVWCLKNEMFLWSEQKNRIVKTNKKILPPIEAMYDTTIEKYEEIFSAYSTVKNVEEDTILLRTPAEIDNHSLRVLNKIESDYKNLFKKPRPKGTIILVFNVNCAGDVYNIEAHRDDIGNKDFLINIAKMFSSLKYTDNLRTNKCGKTEVTYFLNFNG